MRKSRRLEELRLNACARCGYTREAHALANFADGAMIGAPVLVCPFATWKSPPAADAVARSGEKVTGRSTRESKS